MACLRKTIRAVRANRPIARQARGPCQEIVIILRTTVKRGRNHDKANNAFLGGRFGYIFYFFWSGRGKGQSEALGRRRVRVFN